MLIITVALAMFCLPHLGEACRNVQPLSGGFGKKLMSFVGVVPRLSGVEAVANATGVMKPILAAPTRNRVFPKYPPAVFWVMIEVCVFTALLGLPCHALGGLNDQPKDAWTRRVMPACAINMLAYMDGNFVGHAFGVAGRQKSSALPCASPLAFMLLSEANTAMVD